MEVPGIQLTGFQVLQFLQHDGYVETARAFATEIQTEKQALCLDPNTEIPGIDIRDDQDANNRQRESPSESPLPHEVGILTDFLQESVERSWRATSTRQSSTPTRATPTSLKRMNRSISAFDVANSSS